MPFVCIAVEFYYPINLHYSQTTSLMGAAGYEFYYPINLHYSQTCGITAFLGRTFYYPINLHYSQTHIWVAKFGGGFTTL